MIKYTKDTDHIAILTLDMEGRERNILNHEIVNAFLPVVKYLQEEKAQGMLKGVIITSAKRNFLVGGDLKYLSLAKDPQAIFNYSEQLKRFFRELERPGVPVVAAINGTALGTGFELALACHRRIVLNDPTIKLGLPEVKYGVMPGNGGVIRMLWLLGIERAFEVLSTGREWSPGEAIKVGLIDELAGTKAELIQSAKNWLLQQDDTYRPWDDPRTTIPGGTAKDPATARLISRLAAYVSARYRDNYPAPQAILNTLSEGSQVDFETATRIESRYYTALLRSPESRNMNQAMWFDLNQIAGGISRPKGFGKFRPHTVGIVGAGMMGSGIATSCLMNGIEVILKDVSKMIAEQGKEKVGRMLDQYIEEGTIQPTAKEKYLKKIKTTESARSFENCDLVIETVYENAALKKKVITESEEHLDKFAFLATNTVSIPITGLAEKSVRPGQFIDLHFLHPAHKTPLVEIVRGEKTSDETIAKAFDFVKSIGKTPIVVKDDWGFYVARVRNTYILEGVTMLQEGVAPAVVENLGLQAGMPKGALQLADELSLDLVMRYEQQAAQHYGNRYTQHPAVTVMKKMLEDLSRPGGAKKPGFYENGTERQLWPKLAEHFPVTTVNFDPEEIMERFLFVQTLEAVWCLQENVIRTSQEANLGSVLGWGFPAFKGGVIQYVRDYGKDRFIARCSALQKAHGQRFSVPKWLNKNL